MNYQLVATVVEGAVAILSSYTTLGLQNRPHEKALPLAVGVTGTLFECFELPVEPYPAQSAEVRLSNVLSA